MKKWEMVPKEKRPTLVWVFDAQTNVDWSPEILLRWSRLRWVRAILPHSTASHKELLMQENFILIINTQGGAEVEKIPFWKKRIHRILVHTPGVPDNRPDVKRINGRIAQMMGGSTDLLRVVVAAKWSGNTLGIPLKDALTRDLWLPLCRKLSMDPDDFPIQEDRTGLERRGWGRFTVVLPLTKAISLLAETWKNTNIFAVPFFMINSPRIFGGNWARVIPGGKTRRDDTINFLASKIKEKIPCTKTMNTIASTQDFASFPWFYPSGLNTGFCYIPPGTQIMQLAKDLRPSGQHWEWIHLQHWNGDWVLPQSTEKKDLKELKAEEKIVTAKVTAQTPFKWTAETAAKILKGLPIKEEQAIVEDGVEITFLTQTDAETFFEMTWVWGETILSITHPWLPDDVAANWDTNRNEQAQMQKFRELRATK